MKLDRSLLKLIQVVLRNTTIQEEELTELVKEGKEFISKEYNKLKRDLDFISAYKQARLN